MPDALANLEFRLRPPPEARPLLPQCQEPYDEMPYADHYREHRRREVTRQGKDPNCCRNAAMFRLGSKVYCSKHAGKRLLALVEQGKIKLPEDLP